MTTPAPSSPYPRRRSTARAEILARLRAEQYPNLTRELDARVIDPAERYRPAASTTNHKEGRNQG